jgi:hypothetical protein
MGGYANMSMGTKLGDILLGKVSEIKKYKVEEDKAYES